MIILSYVKMYVETWKNSIYIYRSISSKVTSKQINF